MTTVAPDFDALFAQFFSTPHFSNESDAQDESRHRRGGSMVVGKDCQPAEVIFATFAEALPDDAAQFEMEIEHVPAEEVWFVKIAYRSAHTDPNETIDAAQPA